MKKKHILLIILIIILCIAIPFFSFAHSGRTDSNGGHKDNKNVSGLGYYHYHCGGHPPHLHTNGICPYSSASPAAKPSEKSTSSGNTSSSPTQTASADIPSVSSTADSGYNEGYETAKAELTDQFNTEKKQAYDKGIEIGESNAETQITNLEKENDTLKQKVETLEAKANDSDAATGAAAGLVAGGIGGYFLARRKYR